MCVFVFYISAVCLFHFSCIALICSAIIKIYLHFVVNTVLLSS